MKISIISDHRGGALGWELYADVGTSENRDLGAVGDGELGELPDGEAQDWGWGEVFGGETDLSRIWREDGGGKAEGCWEGRRGTAHWKNVSTSIAACQRRF
jgi:hypothetical protein